MFNQDEKIQPYLNHHNDGLFDILLGLAFIWLGMAIALDMAAYTAIAFIVLYSFGRVAKKAITVPRLRPSEVDWPQSEKRQRVKTAVLLIALFLSLLIFTLTFLLVFADTTPSWLANWLDQSLATLILIVVVGLMAFMGYFIQAWRLIGYAALILIAAVSYYWFPLPLPTYAFILGGFTLLIGLVLLVQFIYTHPRLA